MTFHMACTLDDALDRPVSVSDPALGTVRQVFDWDGRVVQIAYPAGQSVHYTYSARERGPRGSAPQGSRSRMQEVER